MLLKIEHVTVYNYASETDLKTHRLMVRPLEGHDVQIRASELLIQPKYAIRWMHDIFGNSIAIVDFLHRSNQLRIESRVTVEQFNTNPFEFVLEPQASRIPFDYAPSERGDVAPYRTMQHPEDAEAIANWIRPFLDVNGSANTLDFLTSLNRATPNFFSYQRREEPGIQSPGETLKNRSGSCRDFAFLFMEAARHLGLAARFVSGYLCQTSAQEYEAASGATHAWAEIYLPGAGWKGFDPTIGILAADSHVRVAVARRPSQATPVAGSFSGKPDDFLGMEVQVNARVVTR